MAVRRLLIKLSPPLIGLTLIIIMGTILFSLFEGISYFDAFYWTIVVISTVGFGDITPQTFMGKILFIVLVVFGLSLFGYFISMISSIITEEKLSSIFKYYFVMDGGRLSGHTIIVGWTDVAKYVYEELVNNNVQCIVLVDDDQLATKLSREGISVYFGSLEDNKHLEDLSIDRASAAIIVEEDPSRMILTILRLRRINKKLKIIVSNRDDELDTILREAGATHVVNSSNVLGRILANYVFEPNAADVAIDLLSAGGLDITEVRVSSRHEGKELSQLAEMGVASKVVLVSRKDKKIYPS